MMNFLDSTQSLFDLADSSRLKGSILIVNPRRLSRVIWVLAVDFKNVQVFPNFRLWKFLLVPAKSLKLRTFPGYFLGLFGNLMVKVPSGFNFADDCSIWLHSVLRTCWFFADIISNCGRPLQLLRSKQLFVGSFSEDATKNYGNVPSLSKHWLVDVPLGSVIWLSSTIRKLWLSRGMYAAGWLDESTRKPCEKLSWFNVVFVVIWLRNNWKLSR